MKTLFTLFLAIVIGFSVSAQNAVSITINHFLDGQPFENNVITENDQEDAFFVDRLQYYLCEFEVTHDGGQVQKIEDLYVLVDLINKVTPTKVELGELNVDKVEAISFRLGVDKETNHADPSLWPTDHPLAPKLPSMHWGWTSGYRFIALEGKCGQGTDEYFQLHCIGNEFHQKLTLPIGEASQEDYDIQLDAEYLELVSTMDLSKELIVHGGINEIIPLVDNFVNKVFSIGGIVNTKDASAVELFEVFPNPTRNRTIRINAEISATDHLINVYSADGRLVMPGIQAGDNPIYFEKAGVYFISVISSDGANLATRKVIVL